MKTIYLRQILSILLCSSLILSCKKETVSPDIEQLLTTKEWMIKDMRAVMNNTLVLFSRGANGNTLNLDNEYMKFNADKTGIYHANSGVESPFTWNFANTEKTKLVWTVQFQPAAVVTWEIYNFNNASIKYIEYYSQGGNNIHGHGERIPR